MKPYLSRPRRAPYDGGVRKRTFRIISGGQTGVDRGALIAALERGVPCGGWVPAGRKAEDGRIPEFFPMREMPTDDYAARTLQNVRDSDATVVIFFSEIEGGTELTVAYCRRERKPYLLLDAHDMDTSEAARRIAEFVTTHEASTLNVAGPRASRHPAGQAWARTAVREFLETRR